jgi:hypothetical protein
MMKKKKSTKTTKTKKQPARSKKESTKAAAVNPGKDVRKAVAKRAESTIKAVKQAEAAVVAAAKSVARSVSKEAAGPKKQYLKSRPAAKVTFRLPHEAAREAHSVSLVGDFNSWHAEATPMKRLRDGSFTAVVELESGHEYRFRYLLEDGRWENDWHADKYAPNAFGGEDSVVAV